MWRVQGRAAARPSPWPRCCSSAVVAVAGVCCSPGTGCRSARCSPPPGTRCSPPASACWSASSRAWSGRRAAAGRLAEVLAEPATRARRTPAAARTGPAGAARRDGPPRRRTVLDGVDLVVPGGHDPRRGRPLRRGQVTARRARRAARRPGRRGGAARRRPARHADRTTSCAARSATPSNGPRCSAGPSRTRSASALPRPSPARVREAARTARADDFVRRLPDGYATPCADAPLSGGESQRLGLARAFAHGGRLLILDDALSSLDTVTEAPHHRGAAAPHARAAPACSSPTARPRRPARTRWPGWTGAGCGRWARTRSCGGRRVPGGVRGVRFADVRRAGRCPREPRPGGRAARTAVASASCGAVAGRGAARGWSVLETGQTFLTGYAPPAPWTTGSWPGAPASGSAGSAWPGSASRRRVRHRAGLRRRRRAGRAAAGQPGRAGGRARGAGGGRRGRSPGSPSRWRSPGTPSRGW